MANLTQKEVAQTSRAYLLTIVGSADTSTVVLKGDITFGGSGIELTAIMDGGVFKHWNKGPDVEQACSFSGMFTEPVPEAGATNKTATWELLNPLHTSGGMKIFVSTYNGYRGFDLEIKPGEVALDGSVVQTGPWIIKLLNCVPTGQGRQVASQVDQGTWEGTFALKYFGISETAATVAD